LEVLPPSSYSRYCKQVREQLALICATAFNDLLPSSSDKDEVPRGQVREQFEVREHIYLAY
jgi:hypothetical protein